MNQPRCDFVTEAEGLHRCRNCGRSIKSPEPPRNGRRCLVGAGSAAVSPARGLGDTIARGLSWLGFEKCAPCADRQEVLNRVFPYFWRKPPPEPQPAKPAAAILIRFPHGLGDVVQLTVLLQHLRHYHPDWTIDVECRDGYHRALTPPLCRAAGPLGSFAEADYGSLLDLGWPEPFDCYADSPSTKAERSIREGFQLKPLAELCRYQVIPGEATQETALAARQALAPDRPLVLMHYQGHTSQTRKNLNERYVHRVAELIRDSGAELVVFDYGRTSGLVRDGLATRLELPPDPQFTTALIATAQLFIGIDSGPGHLAAATDTPALIVWKDHHPCHYYGLSPNVLHLVPAHHAELLRSPSPTRAARAAEFFAANYRHACYGRLDDDILSAIETLIPH